MAADTVEPRRLLVTGGGSGIGQAVCRIASDRGMQVVALDTDADGLAETSAGTRISTVQCDITTEDAVITAVAQASEMVGGPIDSLVAAAGVYRIKPAVELDGMGFLLLMAVNVTGAFLAAREVARHLVDSEVPGSIVFLASMASESGDTHEPAVHYSASKGAVVSMTRQLAVEWAPHEIRVNAVSPGVISTPMLRLTDDPEAAARYLQHGVPLRRLGRADEVARACLFLIGSESSYITGAILPVDGGATIA